MPFNAPDDRFRLVTALLLESTQDAPTSTLQTLMTEVESRDTQYGSDRATQIQAWLTQIESVGDAEDAAIASISGAAAGANSASGSIKQIEVTEEYKLQFDNGTSGTSSLTQLPEAQRARARRALRQKIRRWLDPYNYLSRYVSNGRAIDGA